MRRPRLLVLGSWVAATALATVISAAGVSIVTRDVTSNHSRALAAADVVALLGAGEPAPAGTEPPTTAAPVTPPPPTSAPVTTHDVESTAPASHGSESTPSTSATFAGRGGVISVACAGGSVALVSARPDNGFQVRVRDDGPRQVVVQFAGGGAGDGTLVAACPAGVPALVTDLSKTADVTDADHREPAEDSRRGADGKPDPERRHGRDGEERETDPSGERPSRSGNRSTR